jgi:hypothetical protein
MNFITNLSLNKRNKQIYDVSSPQFVTPGVVMTTSVLELDDEWGFIQLDE